MPVSEMLEGYKILDFFLRLYLIFEVNFLLTGDLNVTAFGGTVHYALSCKVLSYTFAS